MYIARIKTHTSKKKLSHTAILLRKSYRENGDVKTVTIANLTHNPPEEIAAIEWALKNKKNLPEIISTKVRRKTAKSFGGVYLVKEIMKKLSIDKVLGNSKDGKITQLQIISRTLNQGSRLSAVRMASEHQASCELLDICDKITEDDLYKNLAWLSKKQRTLERKLYKKRYSDKPPEIFLYDVTSSYFEGVKNELANWGYNRDKKRGKMQVVAGMLCDESGNPIAIRLFEGNTLDFNTVAEQIKQIAEEFGCSRITFVGDRGMIKSKQIESLEAEDFYYITAITKPQIEGLINEGVIQIGMFDKELKEVICEGIRYILKQNPVRVEALRRIRNEKKAKIEKLLKMKNEYLKEHLRAKPETAIKEITAKIKKLKADKWLNIAILPENPRQLLIQEDQEALADEIRLDGCYVIKSNLPEEVNKEIVHDRYKDLKNVEQGFRCMKTDWLGMRPWYVRKEASTRGHAFVVMLTYMVIKYLKKAWKDLDLTVKEGLEILGRLSLMEVKINGEINYYEVPEPSDMMTKLASLAGVVLPEIAPYKKVNVSSRVKLTREA